MSYTATFKQFAIGLVASAVLSSAALAADAPAPAVKWRLAVSGSATADAELQFRVSPQAGDPIMVKVSVPSGRGPMTIAKNLCDGFKAQLPKLLYRCEVMHGSEVLVKAGHDQPAFSLELVESTLAGAQVLVSAN